MNSYLIAANMMRRALGNWKNWIFFLILPSLVVSVVIGLLGQDTDPQVKVLLLNEDRGNLGAYIAAELESKMKYKLEAVSSLEQLQAMVVDGKASVGLLIPQMFSENILQEQGAQIEQFELITNEETITLKLTLQSMTKGLAETAAGFIHSGIKINELVLTLDRVTAEQLRHNVKAKTTDLELYVSPVLGIVTGMLILFMMGLVNSTVSIIMDDRNGKTMSRIFSAPVRTVEIVVGNFAGSFAIGSLQVALVLLFSRYLLGYDPGLPLWSHFIVLEFFLLTAMGLAMSIAGLVRSRSSIGTINSLIITPTCMLGGCFWPYSIMPDFMQKLGNFVPQKWTIEAIEKLASGTSLSGIGLQLGVLALFAAILLGIGSVILRPGESEAG